MATDPGGTGVQQAYVYEFSNEDLDRTLGSWTEDHRFPYLLATLTLDGVIFTLNMLLVLLCICGKSLRKTPHGWLVLNCSLGMAQFALLDLTGTLGRHNIIQSWPNIPWLCEILTSIFDASLFITFVSVSMVSLERVVSVQRSLYPESGFGDMATRAMIVGSWVLAAAYGTYMGVTTVHWTLHRGDNNVCVSTVGEYPSLVQFLVFVVCLLALSGAMLTAVIWLRSDEVKVEDKMAARAAVISTIIVSVLFYLLTSPLVILALKRYDYIYGDAVLQLIAFYCLRTAGILLPTTWLFGDPDVQAALCCRSSSGADENTFLLERMTSTNLQD